MSKIKFLPRDMSIYGDILKEDFKLVDNPIPNLIEKVNDGEVYIRGNKKEHFKEYWVQNGNWYLVEDCTKFNGHEMTNITTFNLFPMLPHKEYITLKDPVVYSKLSYRWRLYVRGYFFWRELLNLKRNSRKMVMKLKKTT